MRGLIRPGYIQGLRSVIRENLVIEALASETEAVYALERLRADTAIMAPLAGSNTDYMLRIVGKQLDRLRENALLNFTPELQAQGSVDALCKLYEALESVDMIKDIILPVEEDAEGEA